MHSFMYIEIVLQLVDFDIKLIKSDCILYMESLLYIIKSSCRTRIMTRSNGLDALIYNHYLTVHFVALYAIVFVEYSRYLFTGAIEDAVETVSLRRGWNRAESGWTDDSFLFYRGKSNCCRWRSSSVRVISQKTQRRKNTPNRNHPVNL